MEQITPAIAVFLPDEVQDMFYPFASVMLAPYPEVALSLLKQHNIAGE